MKKPFIFSTLILITTSAAASVNSNDLFDSLLTQYSNLAKSWELIIFHHAQWLFWTLALISMVWTFGMMVLRKADLGEFFAEFFRFTMFTGFFWWLLINGPNYATGIIESMRIIAGNATGLGNTLSPSGIVDVGFELFYKAIEKTSIWSPIDAVVGMIISTIVLVILALIGVNILILLISGWILAYAGIFFLGFGGSRWTSNMAINYYKTVLGISIQIFAMMLLIGVGSSFIDFYYQKINSNNIISIKEMGIMLVASIVLLVLTNKVPSLLAGIITGASIGNQGIGNFGAGAITGAAGMAAAVASSGGAAFANGAVSAGSGGASAVKAAVAKAASSISNGTNTFSTVTGSGGGLRSGSKAESGGDASSPLGRAMGFSSGSGKGAIDSANLAKAGFDIGQNKASTHREGFKKSVSDTAGGQMTTAIKNSGNPTKNGAGDR